jgi:hypothetical protein
MRIADELDIFGQKCVYFPLVGVEFQARKGYGVRESWS